MTTRTINNLIRHRDTPTQGGQASPPSPQKQGGPQDTLTEQQLDAITRLPRAEQKFVSKMLDSVLAQYASAGQEAAPA